MSLTAAEKNILELAAASCAAYHLRRAMRTINQRYDMLIRESGLRATQFSLLGAILLEGPVALSELAAMMAMDRTTLSRNLKPLERDGFLQTAPGTDRRTRLIEVTPKGKSVLTAAIPLWQTAQSPLVSQWGPERFKHLLHELAELESLSRALS